MRLLPRAATPAAGTGSSAAFSNLACAAAVPPTLPCQDAIIAFFAPRRGIFPSRQGVSRGLIT